MLDITFALLALAGGFEAEVAQLVPATSAGYYGQSVAIDGTTILVSDRVFGTDQPGAVNVFVFEDSQWSQQATLSVALAHDNFGMSVGLEGDWAVVGAYGTYPSGAAYVFRRGGTTWGSPELLPRPAPIPTPSIFGYCVAIDGTTIVVGAAEGDSDATDVGSAYVYIYDGTEWSEQARLFASDGTLFDGFGISVAIEADSIIVGAPDNNSGQGAAYVYTRSGTAWLEQAKLQPNDGGQHFGSTVSISGDTALVTAIPGAGAVYVFDRTETSWTQTQKLVPTPGEDYGAFGRSTAIAGEVAVIGVPGATVSGVNDAGCAYVFTKGAKGWSEDIRLAAGNAVAGDRLGGGTALDEGRVVLGAPHVRGGNQEAGAAYVFEIDPIFTSFCDGFDEALASCPCGNQGRLDAGCDLPQATGGVKLRVLAQDVRTRSATIQGTGFSGGHPTALLIRSTGLAPEGPQVFADGLRCVSSPVARLSAGFPTEGTWTKPIGHGAAAGTFYYQLWFRSTPSTFCDPMAAFNLSNGRTLTW